jgi:uncharacterized protein (DUF433 family)
MSLVLTADPLPLHADEHGSIRVGNTRVLLEFVIHAYQDGATPEQIVKRFDTLHLADVHAVIAYYLRHRQEIEEYLSRRETEAEETRQRIEAEMPPRVSREELMARWAKRQGQG